MGLLHLFNDDLSVSAPLCWALETLTRGDVRSSEVNTSLLLSQKNILNGHFGASQQNLGPQQQSERRHRGACTFQCASFVDSDFRNARAITPIMAAAALIQAYLCLCQECIRMSDESISFSLWSLPLNKRKQKPVSPRWKHMSHVFPSHTPVSFSLHCSALPDWQKNPELIVKCHAI